LLIGTRRVVLFAAVMLVIAARVEALAFRDRCWPALAHGRRRHAALAWR